MSLKHAILTMVRGRAISGYDLAKQFDMSLKFIWKASHQQIYKELKSLLTEGFIEYERVHQDDRPDKKLYQITVDGEAELKRWVNLPTKERVSKDPLMIKFFAGDLFEQERLANELEMLEKEFSQNIELLQNVPSKLTEIPSNRKMFVESIMKRGEMIELARMKWLQDVKQLLSKNTKA